MGSSSDSCNLQGYNASIDTPDNLSKAVEYLWALDPISQRKHLSPEEIACGIDFNRNTTRDSSGTYIVHLPFKEDVESLGNSYRQAELRFFALERKLENNMELRKGYNATVQEYIDKGFLNKIEASPY